MQPQLATMQLAAREEELAAQAPQEAPAPKKNEPVTRRRDWEVAPRRIGRLTAGEEAILREKRAAELKAADLAVMEPKLEAKKRPAQAAQPRLTFFALSDKKVSRSKRKAVSDGGAGVIFISLLLILL